MHASVPGRWILILAMTLGLATVGCSDDSTAPEDPGTLRVRLIDAPALIDSVEALTLVLSDVRVHESGEAEDEGGWIDLMPDTLEVEERTFDLLELVNGVDAVLGETELAPGTYTQIRLVIEEATITVAETTYPLTIPSGMQSGLKLISPFEISSNQLTLLTLDFDAGRSVVETPAGSRVFKLKPTIRVLQDDLTGEITGTVLPLDIGAQVLAVAPASGDTVTTTFVDALDGGYLLPSLSPGDYDVIATAPGYQDSTVSGIGVAVDSTTSGVDFQLLATP